MGATLGVIEQSAAVNHWASPYGALGVLGGWGSYRAFAPDGAGMPGYLNISPPPLLVA